MLPVAKRDWLHTSVFVVTGGFIGCCVVSRVFVLPLSPVFARVESWVYSAVEPSSRVDVHVYRKRSLCDTIQQSLWSVCSHVSPLKCS